MKNSTILKYRIDSNIKEEAERIIYTLGITPSYAIEMFYKQIIINSGLPFDARLQTYEIPKAFSSLSKDELNKELMKGYSSITHDEKYTPEEVDLILDELFGLN